MPTKAKKVKRAPRSTRHPGTKALLVVFSDRLTQIVDRRPDIIKTGKGRISDFALKFDIHYTTAYRLFCAKGLPNAALLVDIANTFDVSESWLLGREAADIDDYLAESRLKIAIFSPRSNDPDLFLSLPTSEIPAGLDSSQLLFAKGLADLGPQTRVLVKVAAEPHDGRVHLIYDPKNHTTFLRRVTVLPASRQLAMCGMHNPTQDIVALTKVVFGKTNDAKKLSVVGPVLARLIFGFKGD